MEVGLLVRAAEGRDGGGAVDVAVLGGVARERRHGVAAVGAGVVVREVGCGLAGTGERLGNVVQNVEVFQEEADDFGFVVWEGDVAVDAVLVRSVGH